MSGQSKKLDGFAITYGYIPPEFTQKIFKMDNFERILRLRFVAGIRLGSAINTYTVGTRRGATNYFFDPASTYKDAWIDVCIVYDDSEGVSRTFMLRDPSGDPSDLANIRIDSVISIGAADQRLVYLSAARGARLKYPSLAWRFHFDKAGATTSDIRPKWGDDGADWLVIDAYADSHSLLPDLDIVSKEKNPILALVGVPGPSVYEALWPWHAVHFSALGGVRYIDIDGATPAWAVFYANAAQFWTKDAEQLTDNWPAARPEYERVLRAISFAPV